MNQEKSGINTPPPQEDWETVFKTKLEEVLDEYFPKIEEEGPTKIANKRGPALVLFSEAVILARQAVQEERKKEREEVKNILASHYRPLRDPFDDVRVNQGYNAAITELLSTLEDQSNKQP